MCKFHKKGKWFRGKDWIKAHFPEEKRKKGDPIPIGAKTIFIRRDFKNHFEELKTKNNSLTNENEDLKTQNQALSSLNEKLSNEAEKSKNIAQMAEANKDFYLFHFKKCYQDYIVLLRSYDNLLWRNTFLINQVESLKMKIQEDNYLKELKSEHDKVLKEMTNQIMINKELQEKINNHQYTIEKLTQYIKDNEDIQDLSKNQKK